MKKIERCLCVYWDWSARGFCKHEKGVNECKNHPAKENSYILTEKEAKEYNELKRPCLNPIIKNISEYERACNAFLGLGKWMSAALLDDNVCEEMKLDIQHWFLDLEYVIKHYEKDLPEEDRRINIKGE